MAEVIPQINIDGTKIKNTWTEKEYVTDEVYNALNKAVIDLKNNNNLLDSNSILFREEYNSSSKNLNNAIHQGIYSFTNSAVNAPSGVNGGNLLVTNTSKTNQGTSIITQIAFCHNGAVYARTKNTSENFTAWNKLAYTESPAFSGTPTAPTPSTSTNNTQIATTAFVNSYAPSKSGSGASGTWGININGNAGTATKSTQDSQGQQINTTYVKGITVSNATLTVTKGNGTTSTVTVNNVAHATNSDNSTNTGNFNQGFQTNEKDFPASTFRQTILGRANSGICARPFCGRFPTNSGEISNSGIAFGGIDTHGFIQMAYGSPSVYVGGGNANRIIWYKKLAITESPAFSGTPTAPTPSTSDNGTRVATTAFVQSLLTNKFTASKATNGWWKDGNTGIVRQWGYIYQGQYSAVTHNFPISFPNQCFAVIAICAGDVGTGATKNAISTNILSKSQFKVSIGEFSSVYWEAIGY